MESLNLKTLASSLPTSANAEKQLMDNFKAAALSITTLYRSSLDTSKQAYSAGYAACLLDVLHFVEAGVSVSGSEGEDMTIGKVMDWIDARLEAIKSTAEEEEEDRLKEGSVKSIPEEPSKEEREKRSTRKVGSNAPPPNQSRLHRRSKENPQEVLQAGGNPHQQLPSHCLPSTSPPAHSLTSPSPPPPFVRQTRPKRGLKDLGPSPPFNANIIPLPVAVTPSPGTPPLTFSSDVIYPVPVVGSKRRHAAIVAESPASSSAGLAPPTQTQGHSHGHCGSRRKRTRNGRDHGVLNANGNTSQGQSCADAMEVEEDGRERRKIARR